MAKETPNLKYYIKTDDPKDDDNNGCGFIVADILLVISIIPFLVGLIAWIFDGILIAIICLIILIIILATALNLKYSYDKTSPRLKEAERAKSFLGFDFGDKFTLRTRGKHEYMEILLDFNEESFKPLEEFCKSQKESHISLGKTEPYGIESYIEVKPYLLIEQKDENGFSKIKKSGYTKIHNDGSGATNCEVDYENRTLKYYVWWC